MSRRHRQNKAEGAKDKARGNVKEAGGSLTGNKDRKAEGRTRRWAFSRGRAPSRTSSSRTSSSKASAPSNPGPPTSWLLASSASRGVTFPAFSRLKGWKATTGARKVRTTVGKKRRGYPAEALDKAAGQLGEAAGSIIGEVSLEAKGGRCGGRAS